MLQFEWAKLRFQQTLSNPWRDRKYFEDIKLLWVAKSVVTLSCISCTDVSNVSMCMSMSGPLHRPDSKGKSEMPTGGLSLTRNIEVHFTTWQYIIYIHIYYIYMLYNAIYTCMLFFWWKVYDVCIAFPWISISQAFRYVVLLVKTRQDHWMSQQKYLSKFVELTKMQAELKSTRVVLICWETFERTDLPIKHRAWGTLWWFAIFDESTRNKRRNETRSKHYNHYKAWQTLRYSDVRAVWCCSVSFHSLLGPQGSDVNVVGKKAKLAAAASKRHTGQSAFHKES